MRYESLLQEEKRKTSRKSRMISLPSPISEPMEIERGRYGRGNPPPSKGDAYSGKAGGIVRI